jgi:hypothetical protein
MHMEPNTPNAVITTPIAGAVVNLATQIGAAKEKIIASQIVVGELIKEILSTFSSNEV